MAGFKKILVIIRRSNGDVFLTEPLIRALKTNYEAQIDLLINADTAAIAKTIPFVDNLLFYDYGWKGFEKTLNEMKLFWKIFKKYDLAINLTTNDRSARYAAFSAKHSISVIEKEKKKNWWKKLILKKYFYDDDVHIVKKTLKPLEILNIKEDKLIVKSYYKKETFEKLKSKFPFLNEKYIIFHPSAQYEYKVYPENLRNKLLEYLNTLNVPVVITGGKSKIDEKISKSIPKLNNIYNLMGKTSLEEYIAISDNSLAYVGMDTLNMHIAASQNKRIFAIFGPTFHRIWSPWSNELQTGATGRPPLQEYGNVTLFQADMECVPCGKAGCDDKHGKSECLYKISPEIIFDKVKKWIKSA
jgi:heptosyltransferase-3